MSRSAIDQTSPLSRREGQVCSTSGHPAINLSHLCPSFTRSGNVSRTHSSSYTIFWTDSTARHVTRYAVRSLSPGWDNDRPNKSVYVTARVGRRLLSHATPLPPTRRQLRTRASLTRTATPEHRSGRWKIRNTTQRNAARRDAADLYCI